MDVEDPDHSHIRDEQDKRAKLAFDEAVRALSAQHDARMSVGTRAGTLISAAAIATSFLGGLALDEGNPTVCSWIAIGLFVAVGGTTLWILRPVEPPSWVSPTALDNLRDERPNLRFADIQMGVATQLEAFYEEARLGLRRLRQLFEAASVLLVLEILAWVVDLASRG